MREKGRAILWCFVVLILSGGFACRHRAQVQLPPALFSSHLRKGDEYFAKGHLWGWRKAEEEYKNAWSMAQPEELLARRVRTLALMAVRERDESLFGTPTGQEIQSLGPVKDTNLRLLIWLAKSYGQPGIQPLPADLPDPSDSMFDLDESASDAYLYLALLKTCAPDRHKEVQETLIERFGSSPLFAYSYPGEPEEILRTYPDFAEMYAYQAHLDFSRQQFNRARDGFLKCLEFLPDHTGALNTLGDVYLFGLRDYAKALEYYEASLEIDPRNLEALFGRGVVFHYLGHYAESSRVLDSVLNGNARLDHLSDKQRNYYRGQGFYYKAYNAYLLTDMPAARLLVNTSRTYLPRFGGSCYLSGLLHYRNREVDPAERDFITVLSEGTSYCDASYYLGLIDRTARDGATAPAYFLACADCYRKNLAELKQRLLSIPAMDLMEAEKQILEARVLSEIGEFGESSAKILEEVLQILPQLEFEGKEVQTNLVMEVLQQLRLAGDHVKQINQ